MKFAVSNSPHIAGKQKTRRLMLDVVIALVPAMAASILFFGYNALLHIIISCAAAFVCELLFTLVWKNEWNMAAVKNSSVWDFSFLITGILVALNVPAAAPLWITVVGSGFAILLVKMMFGGMGKNFANPAMSARIFLFIALPSIMAAATATAGFAGDAVTGPTWLAAKSGAFVKDNWLEMFLGNKASAAMGETSILALLLGYAYLCVRKVIDFKLPLYIIGGVAVFALIFDGLINNSGSDILYVTLGHVLSGGLFLGAVFMATDYSTSPNTELGTLIYGLGIALLAVLIRVFGSYPEGMSFAIVIMNIIACLLDKYVYPKPFGYFKCKKVECPVPKKVTETLEAEE